MVSPSGILDGDSLASDHAMVFGQVTGQSKISGKAIIGHNCYVHDSIISGHTLVSHATLLGSIVEGNITLQNVSAVTCAFYGTCIWDFEHAAIKHVCVWGQIP